MNPHLLLLTAMAVSAGSALATEPMRLSPPGHNPGYHRAVNELTWTPNSFRSSIARPLPLPAKNTTRKAPVKAGVSASDIPELHGCICYMDSWVETQDPKVGLYTISPSDLTPDFLDEDMLSSYGQVYAGDKYFVAVPEIYYGFVVDMKYHVYDTQTWKETVVQGDWNFMARAMAFDPMTRRAYAIMENADNVTFSLASVDMETFAISTIKDYGASTDWSALMCSPKGELYGIDKAGTLVKFDKHTGDFSIIGSTGLASRKMTAATIDPATGRCYYNHYNDNLSEMYEVNLTDASVTHLFSVPESAQILSLYLPEKAVATTAPARAEDLKFLFEGASMSGKLSFNAPAADMGGSALSGEITYTVSLNGEQISKGTTTPGSSLSTDITIDGSGEYTAAITFANASGEGETAYITAWLGNDRPAAVTNLKLTESDGKLQLTWTPVTGGTMSGYFDPEAVTYTVTSYPGGKEVATGLTTTSFEAPIPTAEAVTRFNYGVTAVLGDSRSAESISNNYLAGNIIPPFTEDFTSADAMDFFTVIDGNGDNKSWKRTKFADSEYLLIEYSFSSDLDDWAVLWPAVLEADHTYTIGCDARATTDNWTERLELKVASAADIESLRAAEPLVGPTDIVGENWRPFKAEFTPETTGIYYVAFHACSPKGQNKLFVDNVHISQGVATKAPAAINGIKITPDSKGALNAVLSFNAPTKDIKGRDLENISHVLIERAGEEIGRVNTTKPGEALTFKDEKAVNGINTYTITAYNSYGRGESANASEYIGVVAPWAPEEINITLGDNPGSAVIEWTPADIDEKGHPLDQTNVSYTLMRSFANGPAQVVAEGIKECSFVDQVVKDGGSQGFVYYGVKAVTAGGESYTVLSNIMPVGTPYSTPVREAFRVGSSDHIWVTEAPEDSFTAWDIYDPEDLAFDTFDGDGVAVAFAMYQSDNNVSSMYSGLFDLSGLSTPTMSFYFFDVACQNKLEVRVSDGKTWKTVKNVKFGEKDMEWHKQTVDLSEYAGKVIYFELFAQCVDINVVAVDNLRIGNDPTPNLAALAIKAPEKAAANETITIGVDYENTGKDVMSDYSIELYLDGEKIDEIAGTPIEPESMASVEFSHTLTVVSSDAPEFHALIRCNSDADESDNMTGTATVKFIKPTLPAPNDLKAQSASRSIELTWTPSDLSEVPVIPSTDNLESYKPFSIGLPHSIVDGDDLGEWTVYDMDGLPTYTSTRDYPNIGLPQAFMIYNGFEAGDDLVFASHSGHQMFICMASKPDGGKHNDDWLISPLLCGMEQTIAFYARSVSAAEYGPDTFEILYSTSGKEIDDFKLLTTTETTGDWVEYEYTIPEGALYFAIHCISNDKYALLVDDITMVREQDVIRDIESTGYNIYCNGRKINDAPVSGTSYSHDRTAGLEYGKTYRYQVSCVFNYGESAPSDPAEVVYEGESSIDDTMATSIRISAGAGVITVDGAEGGNVIVCNPAGQTVYSTGSAPASLTIPVVRGIYLVKASSSVAKVAVR